MTKFSVSRRVPYTPDQVFGIASNVEDYRHFLPLVKASSVRNRVTRDDGVVEFDSTIQIAYHKLGISESLTSHVTVDPGSRVVRSTSNEGPVTSLTAEWRIAEAPGGAEIHFTVDYTLRSRSMQFLISGMFDMLVRRILNAFEERARKLYGAAAV
jgi:coenzyme Q-binding protein COQ10